LQFSKDAVFTFRKSIRYIVLILSVLSLFSGVVLTQEAQQTYPVTAGAFGPVGTGIVVLEFVPQTLQVHRGDIVEWEFVNLGTINTGEERIPVTITHEIEGTPRLVFNPEIVNATLTNGSNYEVNKNSGLIHLEPDENTFSLVMDVEPGFYRYHNDLFPEMTGVIEVVDDTVEIPSVEEVVDASEQYIQLTIQRGLSLLSQTLQEFPASPEGDNLPVQIGAADDGIQIHFFFPPIATIQVGQSVTWTVAPGRQVYTVNLPAPPESEEDTHIFEIVEVVSDNGGETNYLLTDLLIANIESGATVLAGDEIRSGILGTGSSFTLTFAEPGTYIYFSVIEGIRGAIIVKP
jgi:plastocyanin